MQTVTHQDRAGVVVELVDDRVIATPRHALELIHEVLPPGVDRLVLHRRALPPEFFVLRSGFAGELLQKFVNYHVRVAIVGDFSDVPGESFAALVREANRGRHLFFVPDVEAARRALTGEA